MLPRPSSDQLSHLCLLETAFPIAHVDEEDLQWTWDQAICDVVGDMEVRVGRRMMRAISRM